MKVGIFNRWLHTMGGAEQYTLALAEVLGADNEVELLTHDQVAIEELCARLGAKGARFSIRLLPRLPDQQLAAYTADYDLFVNACYMCSIPSRAKHSLLVVYFPIPFSRSRRSLLRRSILDIGSRLLSAPVYADGFYPEEAIAGKVYRWTDGIGTLLVPVRSNAKPLTLQVELRDRPAGDAGSGRVAFHVDGGAVATYTFQGRGGSEVVQVSMPSSVLRSPTTTVQVLTDVGKIAGDARPLGVAVGNISIKSSAFPIDRLASPIASRWLQQRCFWHTSRPQGCWLDSYAGIYAISEFSRTWIRRYWKRDSVVLYPPVEVGGPGSRDKRNLILTAGRFFAGSHNKKHLTLIKAFKRMVDGGLTGWEYHLVGGVAAGPEHATYFDRVRHESRGYPIVIHPDVPLAELRALYRDSKIYWHATGYGENEAKNPVRFEHFGITTVEAMGAGCVPVVIGTAGQAEIVAHGANGYLWRTLAELEHYTRVLADDEALRDRLSKAAVERSADFSRRRFAAECRRLLEGLGLR